jgi:hypothetical protein
MDFIWGCLKLLGWIFILLLGAIVVLRFLDLRVKSLKDLPQSLSQKDEN